MRYLFPLPKPAALFLLLAAPFAARAQTGGVGIGTTAPDPSAALEIKSSTQGLLPPRLSQVQRDGIAAPAAGLLIFNTTTGHTNQWDGTRWTEPLALEIPSTFAYTGEAQTYTVPAGATSLRVDLAGAAGGPSVGTSTYQGLGGRVQTVLAVTAGQVLTLYVGGAGAINAGGFNGGGGASSDGGGGGGATDLRQGGTGLADRVLVAGGGGGGGYHYVDGGCGGGLTACAGGNFTANTGGGGGTPTGPGAGGIGGGSNASGDAGSGAVGGTAFGLSGGGGGGYFGGGSGGVYSGGGGGGGSSYAGPGTSGVTHTPGAQAGNGYVRLTPGVVGTALPAPVLDASNFVGLPAPQTLRLSGQSLGISGGNTVTLPPGDNLGNHTATQNLNLAGNQILNTGRVSVGVISPRGSLDVSTVDDSYLVADPANGNSQSLFLPGHLFLAPYNSSTPIAFIQARVPRPTAATNMGLTLRTTSAGGYTDALVLDANGTVHVPGTLELGFRTATNFATMAANSINAYTVDCPSGYYLVGGGGGHRDTSLAQSDITVNYSGPDDNAPGTRWLVRLSNQATTDRNVVVRCNCARIR